MELVEIEGRTKGCMTLGSKDDKLGNLYEKIRLARYGVDYILTTYSLLRSEDITIFNPETNNFVGMDVLEKGMKEELISKIKKEYVNSLIMLDFTIQNNSKPFSNEGFKKADLIQSGIYNTYLVSLNDIVKDINPKNCMGKIHDMRESINQAVSNLPTYFQKWNFYNSIVNKKSE